MTSSADHPRMRGANFVSLVFAGIAFGSSPHARGKRWDRTTAVPTTYGSSPHARGKLVRYPIFSEPRSDHPRMRGANELVSEIYAKTRRIIPACAGQTNAFL